MGWDEARKDALDAQSGGDFLSLKEDGASAKVVFRGEPYSYQQVWIASENKSELYQPDNPAHKNIRPSRRFKINAYNTEARCIQVFEMSATTLSRVDAAVNGVRDRQGKIDPDLPGGGVNAIYKIVRSGTGTKTSYSVNHIKALTAEQRATVDALELHVLAPPAASAPAVDVDDDEIPF